MPWRAARVRRHHWWRRERCENTDPPSQRFLAPQGNRAPRQGYQLAVLVGCSIKVTWILATPPMPGTSPKSHFWSSELCHAISVSLDYVIVFLKAVFL